MNFFKHLRSSFVIDARSLIVFRLYIGLLAIYDGLIKFPHIRWLYTKDAYMDFYSLRLDPGFWLHQLIASLTLENWQVLIGLQILAGCFIISGKFTKFFMILWLFIIRLTMRRNPLGSHIGDLVFTFFSYAALFLPLEKQKNEPNFLSIQRQYSGFDILPYFTQFISLFFFAAITKLTDYSWRDGNYFAIYIQKKDIWENYAFLANQHLLMTMASFTVPYLQIFFSFFVLVKNLNAKTSALFFFFWFCFLCTAYFLVSEATMPFFLGAMFFPLIPPRFWNFWGRKTSVSVVNSISSRSKLFKLLAVGFSFIVVSSNTVSLMNQDSQIIQTYESILSHSFLYQYWRVFSNTRKEQSYYVFSVQKTPESQLEPLPPVEKPDSLIAGRFVVMRRVIENQETLRHWVRALCLDLEEQYKQMPYAVSIDKIRRVSNSPPEAGPTDTKEKTESFVCGELSVHDMHYGE